MAHTLRKRARELKSKARAKLADFSSECGGGNGSICVLFFSLHILIIAIVIAINNKQIDPFPQECGLLLICRRNKI